MTDVEQFICEIRRRPVLWDANHPDYNHRQAKLSNWEEVAANMYVDWGNWSNYDKFGKVRDLQKRWKNIRDNFIRELKYEKKVEEGKALAKERKYIYSHLLNFLVPKKTDKTEDSSNQNTSDQDGQVEADDDFPLNTTPNNFIDEGYSTSQGNEQSLQHYVQAQYSHRDISEQSFTGIHPPTEDTIAGPSALEQDTDKMYLLSLLPYFKKLSEERKLQARIHVAQLLHDMLYKPA